VFAAIALNFALAVWNAQVWNLNRDHIIFAEVAVVLVAILICYRASNKLMVPWLIVVWMLVITSIFLSLFRHSIEAKYFRDILLIPVFITLGLTFARGNVVRLFAILQGFVLAVMLFEAIFPMGFGEVANPLRYYVNTRGTAVDAFWNTDSVLYISATRPQDRFFEWLDIHRLSSVFLEPVSLGNWCIVITIFTVALWRDLTRRMVLFFVISNIVILVGCDGRLATVTSAIIVAVSLIAPRLPRYSHALYLPGVILFAFVLMWILGPPSGDTFLGRVRFSTNLLSSFDPQALLGINRVLIDGTEDSGISYFIQTQSIIGATIIWVAICFLQSPYRRMSVVLVHGITIYIALSLLISYSMFSIKTAAPLWFLYGVVRLKTALAPEVARA
jgi:putative polymerase